MNSSRTPAARLFFALFLLLLVLVLAAGPSAAQEVTGSLQGTVVSPEGKPEPEVRVSVSGRYLQGAREATTDREGFFQVLALPPGTYVLRLSRVGLRPLEMRDIRVDLGHATGLGRLTLEPQPIEMKAVEAVAKPLSLDPVHTTSGGTLEARDYAALPVDRDYKSLMVVLPQANDSHRGDPLNVSGATGLENAYYIDGVNVTDPRMADRATSLPYDFVRAVDVKTGGYEAQYGRALGAIVNAVTYSGTNDFEGSIFGFAQPGQWAASPRLAPVVTESAPLSYDYGVRVGGPVLRDRLWYSAAFNPRQDRVDRAIPGIGSFRDRTTAMRFAGKLTWRVNPKVNLEASMLGDPTVRDLVSPPLAGLNVVLDPDPLLGRMESGGMTGSLRATVTPVPTLLLQGSLAAQRTRYFDRGATARNLEPYVTDWFMGTTSGGYGGFNREDRDRNSLTLRGTLTLPGHTLATGIDYEDIQVSCAYDWRKINRVLDSSYVAIHFAQAQGTFHNRSPAAYVQDTWRLTNRLSLNAGLRWSAQFMVGASGRIDQRITDEWQPRAGFVWQPGRPGTQRVFGSYGRFYQTLPANIAALMLVDNTAQFTFYATDPRLPDAVPILVMNGNSAEANYSRQIPGLHGENHDELTLGYERLVGGGNKVSVRGTYRSLRSSLRIAADLFHDPVYVLGMPGSGDLSFLPRAKREYTGLEFAAEGTWSGVSYRASYVLSRNWGNYPGLYDSDFSMASPGQTGGFFGPQQAKNTTGYLPDDHTHVVKLSASCTTGFGLSGGALLTFETGSPINDFGAYPLWDPGVPEFLVQRGTAGRTPALWNLDLRMSYDLPAMHATRARLQADVMHVGNPRGVTQVQEMHYPTEDRTLVNPLYKHPIAYQPPMAVRLGLQVSF